jgi:two-component system, sensor histidine kinase RpfC
MRVLQRAGELCLTVPKRVAARLRGRPDTEHEMSLNRLVFAAIIVLILLLERKSGAPSSALVSMTIFIALSLALLGHIILFPKTSRPRRIIALILDCSFLGWQLHLGGEKVALFYPVYLWVIFGNGFRFGLGFLAAAVPVATLSFALVFATTPYWQKQWHLSAGLLIGLIILPAYCGTLIRKLSRATRSAEEANNAKSLFLASVSHELRTPLTAIAGMSGLLRHANLNKEESEMVETINLASESLQTLINGLLDLSRIDAGHMPNLPEKLDLMNLLVDIRRIVERQVIAKNLRFSVHVTPRTPPILLANRQHLFEIILNLVGNAVKFTEHGTVVVAVDGEAAEYRESKVRLTIEVSDTGIGIARQDQTRIFDDFTQANSTIMNRFGGTGLGLAITKRRAALFDGTIDVESTLGQGSTFRVSLMTHFATTNVEPSPANEAAVTLVASNEEIIIQLRAALLALGGAVRVVRPRSTVLDSIALKSSGIVLVHAPDLEFIEPAISCSSSTVVLIDETAGNSLPDVVIQRRCIAVLSDISSMQSLSRVLATAQRLSYTHAPLTSETTATAAEAPSKTKPAQSRHVLLVDDNRVNQRVFTRILESGGHEVTIAENGEKALDILAKEAGRIDIVLMDFNMPELDGLETTRMFRMMSLGEARLPILGLTADISANSDSRWRAAGMDGCLIKPIEPEAFLTAIDAIARRTTSGTASSVAILREHPRFRKQTLPAFDEIVIANLERLGDRTFVIALLSDFVTDSAEVIGALSAAATEGNTTEFRNQAHALRSSAVNVGATALAELCGPWVDQRGIELKARAAEFAARAQAELLRTRKAVSELDVGLSAKLLT